MLTQADVHWIELDSVGSTNEYLGQAYLQGRVSGISAVLAHAQTAGRGRAGRAWTAMPGASLCLSVGVPLAGHQLPVLPLCVGVAVAQVLEGIQVPVRLKWPNDLLLDQRKLGGVLCESFQAPQGPVTVIGLGLNIRPVALASPPGSLSPASLADVLDESSLPASRQLAEALTHSILAWIDQAQHAGHAAVFREFSQRDAWRGRKVQVMDQGQVQMVGMSMGLDSSGAYLLDTAQGLRSIMAGDVSLRVEA